MKSVSMWVVLGMSLFMVLSTEAQATIFSSFPGPAQVPISAEQYVASGTLAGDPGIAVGKRNTPITPTATQSKPQTSQNFLSVLLPTVNLPNQPGASVFST